MRISPLGRLSALSALAAFAVLGTACSDLGIGRRCPSPNKVTATQISTPALDCISRLCFLKADAQNNLQRSVCTAHCTTDADCANGLIPGANDQNSVGLCTSKFVCAVATTVDTYKCQTLCICQDDLVKGFNSDPTNSTACCPQSCDTAALCPANLPKC